MLTCIITLIAHWSSSELHLNSQLSSIFPFIWIYMKIRLEESLLSLFIWWLSQEFLAEYMKIQVFFLKIVEHKLNSFGRKCAQNIEYATAKWKLNCMTTGTRRDRVYHKTLNQGLKYRFFRTYASYSNVIFFNYVDIYKLTCFID